MKTFTITVQSKNKISINTFFLVLKKIFLTKWYNIKNEFIKNKVKKRITILESPHVNKKAQEQFEIQFFKRQFTIKSMKIFKHLILLKKLNFNLFSDVNIILNYKVKKIDIQKLCLKIFMLENFKLKKFIDFKNYNLTFFEASSFFLKLPINFKINSLLNVFDSYGEVFKK